MKRHIFASLIISFFIFYAHVFPQWNSVRYVPTSHIDIKESFPLAINENEIFLFYVNSTQDSIFSIKTNDNGLNWSSEKFIHLTGKSASQELLHLTAMRTTTGRILLAWSPINDSMRVTHSDDNGLTWSQPDKLSGSSSSPLHSENLSLNQFQSGRIILSFNVTGGFRLVFRTSDDNGESWSEATDLKYGNTSVNQRGIDLNFISINDSSIFGVYSRQVGGRIKFYGLSALETSLERPDTVSIFESAQNISRVRLLKTIDQKLWIVFQALEPTELQDYSQYDIFYINSDDNGTTWSDPQKFTNYLGDDFNHNTVALNNHPIISFSTKRFTNKNLIGLGQIGVTSDNDYPPYILDTWIEQFDQINKTINVRSRIIHDSPGHEFSVVLFDTLNAGQLYDDGKHNDGEANDFIFGNDFILPPISVFDSYRLDVNNIKLPLNNSGTIARVLPLIDIPLDVLVSSNNSLLMTIPYKLKQLITNYSGGLYDGHSFLFTGGFMMSGLDENGIWANHLTYFNDYQAGTVGSSVDDIRNKIYVVRADDPPFGHSWQQWRYAVELGAEFYDGDGDGVYNPVDRNYNGTWDPDEDMPLMIGDETVWFVINDGIPADQRLWDSEPKQIEIAQTLFASNKPGLENIIFIRHKIINKSSSVYDSVYLGFYADADIGSHQNDLFGCDTLLNSGYFYKVDPDPFFYGDNPPSFFTTLLQGPVISSENNSDTATIKFGEHLGTQTVTQAKNINISSHFGIWKAFSIDLNDPNNINAARYNLQGLLKTGLPIDPCNFPLSGVFGGVDCSTINPRFNYSGDPVSQTGWIAIQSWDVRSLLNIGPFKLEPNKPQHIISAYIVGRGEDPLNSITITRNYVMNAIQEYENNFSSMTYVPNPPTNPVVNYKVYQNYPNPFNPVTTIRFEMPDDGVVVIKIYDILGREVETLLNEYRHKNRYEIDFDAEGLASGVYFYQIKVNNFIETKKMMLIR